MDAPPVAASATDIRRAALALDVVETEPGPLSAADLGRKIGLSAQQVRRAFRSAVGLSPDDYQKLRRSVLARSMLRAGSTVEESTNLLGLSSTSRLHDLTMTTLAVRPGTVRARGAGLTLRWDVIETLTGPAVAAVSEIGLVSLHLLDHAAEAEHVLAQDWPLAQLDRCDGVADDVETALCQPEIGYPKLHLIGSSFQLQVWRALLQIASGETTTYGHIAGSLGRPSATRAVSRAIATNRIARLVPCHRVISSTGVLSGYRWGTQRKQRLLVLETVTNRPSSHDRGISAQRLR